MEDNRPDHSKFYNIDASLVVECEDIFALAFEIKTKKFLYTKENMKKVEMVLGTISKFAHDNDSTSLHVHASRSDYSRIQHYALLYEYLRLGVDKKLLKIKDFWMEHEGYASYKGCRAKYYYRVNSCLRDYNNGKRYVVPEVNNSKSDLYHIHSDFNTIEWRGLRNHLSIDRETLMESINTYLSYMENLQYDPMVKRIFKYE